MSPELREKELEVTYFRASGPGGQHRNRRETGVRIRHKPTGVVVAASERRSQAANLAVALARLAERLAARRRQRRRRIATRPSRASAQRRVETKRHRGRLKATRGRVSGD